MKLWIPLLAGPMAWFASLVAAFASVPLACAQRGKLLPVGIPAAALAIALVCGSIAWSTWRQTGREFPGEDSGDVARTRVMASGGVLLNAMFVVVIAAQLLVPAFLGVCE